MYFWCPRFKVEDVLLVELKVEVEVCRVWVRGVAL